MKVFTEYFPCTSHQLLTWNGQKGKDRNKVIKWFKWSSDWCTFRYILLWPRHKFNSDSRCGYFVSLDKYFDFSWCCNNYFGFGCNVKFHYLTITMSCRSIVHCASVYCLYVPTVNKVLLTYLLSIYVICILYILYYFYLFKFIILKTNFCVQLPVQILHKMHTDIALFNTIDNLLLLSVS